MVNLNIKEGHLKEIERKVGIRIPSFQNLMREEERIRRVFVKTKSVAEALKVARYLTPHEVLRICAEEKLKAQGYRIISRDEAPEWIKRVGSPDVIAEKNGEYILVEVKPSGQLVRCSLSGVKTILVTNIETSKHVEVWGIRELEDF